MITLGRERVNTGNTGGVTSLSPLANIGPSPHRCINQHWRCDCMKDCDSGEDELGCPTCARATLPTSGPPHPADCNFTSSMCLWKSAYFADMTFVRNRGRTPSWQTGPDGDFPSGSGSSTQSPQKMSFIISFVSFDPLFMCCFIHLFVYQVFIFFFIYPCTNPFICDLPDEKGE